MTATETMLHHSGDQALVLHNEVLLPPSPRDGDRPSAVMVKECCGSSSRDSLTERAVAAGTGELSWGSQAALAPFLGEESVPGGGETGGVDAVANGVMQLSLQGDSSSDTLGEEEDHELLESPGVGVSAEGGEVREVAKAGGYAYGRLVRGASGGSAVFELVKGPPNILPNPDLLQERGRPSLAGFPHVPVPSAITRSFGEENNSMIDRRAWLEVEDPKHRYAKNLRLYYKEWDRRGQPLASFWEWLETDPVELDDCPRSQLDVETVQYCDTDSERHQFEVYFEDGRLYRRSTGQPVNTDAEGWIFVLRNNAIYANAKKTDCPPRFHHSSFFAGECIQAAGLFVAIDGCLTRLYPHSGHYRPTDSHLLTLLLFLEKHGVDLASLAVDVQLVMKVARDQNRYGRKRKIDSPYLWTGQHAKHFLEAKRCGWASKLFDAISTHPLVLSDQD